MLFKNALQNYPRVKYTALANNRNDRLRGVYFNQRNFYICEEKSKRTLDEKKLKALDTLHIPVWLAKDIAWLLVYKPLGVAMILPAVAIALHLCVKTVFNKFLFYQNLAILFWISANSTWMAGEFFHFAYKVPAVLFFTAGILAITWHYILEFKSDNEPLTKPGFVRYLTKRKF